MIGILQAKDNIELINKIEGTVVATGTVGTNTAGSPNFSDLTVGAFTGVEVGDVLQISGTLTTYTVLTVSTDNALVMATNIGTVHTADAVWRIRRGGIGAAAMLFQSPYRDGSRWLVFYETTTFGN